MSSRTPQPQATPDPVVRMRTDTSHGSNRTGQQLGLRVTEIRWNNWQLLDVYIGTFAEQNAIMFTYNTERLGTVRLGVVGRIDQTRKTFWARFRSRRSFAAEMMRSGRSRWTANEERQIAKYDEMMAEAMTIADGEYRKQISFREEYHQKHSSQSP